MKEEITKVLTMVQEGKIDADKGAELIQVLKEKEEKESKQPESSSKYMEKVLKIRVKSAENDNVQLIYQSNLSKWCC
ncbi:polyhydroxyalkanoate synthesis regulator phasin [Cytobacillus kochii]|nr:polyhydroxyalkanoate synthesis regulator phasin [Cytobacillus kochii]